MDADGDGKLSLQEFQAAHERIFRAMDANKDGLVTLEEMQDFLRGADFPTVASHPAGLMNRLLIVGILIMSMAPRYAEGQQANTAKLKADAQKVVSIIRWG